MDMKEWCCYLNDTTLHDHEWFFLGEMHTESLSLWQITSVFGYEYITMTIHMVGELPHAPSTNMYWLKSQHGLIMINNQIHYKGWNQITCAVEVWELICNFIPHFLCMWSLIHAGIKFILVSKSTYSWPDPGNSSHTYLYIFMTIPGVQHPHLPVHIHDHTGVQYPHLPVHIRDHTRGTVPTLTCTYSWPYQGYSTHTYLYIFIPGVQYQHLPEHIHDHTRGTVPTLTCTYSWPYRGTVPTLTCTYSWSYHGYSTHTYLYIFMTIPGYSTNTYLYIFMTIPVVQYPHLPVHIHYHTRGAIPTLTCTYSWPCPGYSTHTYLYIFMTIPGVQYPHLPVHIHDHTRGTVPTLTCTYSWPYPGYSTHTGCH